MSNLKSLSVDEINILAVDDDSTMLESVHTALLKLGFRNVKLANNVEDSKKILPTSFEEGRPIHLIFCDHHMPGSSGHDLIQFIRMSMNFRDIGFVTVTSDSSRDVILPYISTGADSYIVKPIQVDDLRTKVKQVLQRHGIQVQNMSK